MTLPTDDAERKLVPVWQGFICYFPDAIVEVAKHSAECNEQHNPGQPLHWNRAKSQDELGSLARHLLELSKPLMPDYELKVARAVAWRAMANLQKTIERQRIEIRECPGISAADFRLKD